MIINSIYVRRQINATVIVISVNFREAKGQNRQPIAFNAQCSSLQEN